MSNDRHIAVVGGGITGLAAAHALVGRGAPVTLFEAADRLGGVIRTSPFADHPAIDEGADAFLARVPWGVELAAGRLARRRADVARHRQGGGVVGRLARHPRRLAARSPDRKSSAWPARRCCRCAASCGPPPSRCAHAATRHRTRSASTCARGSATKCTSGSSIHSSAASMRPTPTISAWRPSLSWPSCRRSRAACCLSSRRHPAAPAGPVFYAPTGGMSDLVESVGAAIVAGGGEIRRGVAVSELAVDGDTVARRRGVVRRRRARLPGTCSGRAPCRAQLGCRRNHFRGPHGGSGDPDDGATAGQLAGSPAASLRLPRPEAPAAAGDRRVVRIAEVGALGRRRPRRAQGVARSRRSAGAAPHRRRAARRGTDRARLPTSGSMPSHWQFESVAGRTPSPSTAPTMARPSHPRNGPCLPGSSWPVPAITALASPRASGQGNWRRRCCLSG